MIDYTVCGSYALLSEPEWSPLGESVTFRLSGGRGRIMNIFCPEDLSSRCVEEHNGLFTLRSDFFDARSCEGNEFVISFEGDFGRVSADSLKLVRVNGASYLIPCLHSRREEAKIVRQLLIKAYENALEAIERIERLEKGYKTE